jgi:hypothetical protein
MRTIDRTRPTHSHRRLVGSLTVKTRSILICVLVITALLLPLVKTSQASGPPYTWAIGSTPIDSYTGSGVGDVVPSAIQATNGTLWLTWQSDLHDLNGGILYKTMNSTGSWTNPSQLTTGTASNTSPYVTQLSNGTVAIFWSLKTANNYDLYYRRYIPSSNVWSPSTQLTTSSLNDTNPSGAVGKDGTLWLFWQRSNRTCVSCLEDRQIFYRSLKGNTWSSETKLTSDANWNWGPTATVSKDGKVRLVWSKGQGAAFTFNLYTSSYDGSSWTTPSCISTLSACASPVNDDEHPSLTQDRNGTLWLFWGRQQSSSSAFWYVLFDRYSVDNGQTWSAESQISSEPSGVTSQMPFAVQTINASSKPIRLFYISNRSSSSVLNIWNMLSPSISPVHDVRITFVNPSTNLQYPGNCCYNFNQAILTISVTLNNLGDSAETVPVTVTVSNRTSYTLPTQTVPLGLGGFVTLYFNWNTTGVLPARYTVSIGAVPTSGETIGNSFDSNFAQKNMIHIIPWGDIDQNGIVTVTDVGVCIYGFGVSPGSPKWNPFCDINSNGFIDVIDVGVAVNNFGMIS